MKTKDFIFHLRYPYTAGVLIIIWLGTVLLLARFPELPLIRTLIIGAVASLIITYFGFVKK